VEALSLLGVWSADLIVLDLNMPEMDGWTFRLRQLALEHLARVPVVLLSATADVAQEARLLLPAAAVRKPFDLDQLLEVISMFLAPSTATDAPQTGKTPSDPGGRSTA
jgi:CheY-like chemotaxis protein